MGKELKREARAKVERMVQSFNALPLVLFERALIGKDFEYLGVDTYDVTLPSEGDYVIYPESGYIEEIYDGKVRVEGSEEWYEISEVELEDPKYPSWGTVWEVPDFFNISDEEIHELSDIGFIIYDTEYGVYLGIDGGGFDFYEAFWIPLAKVLGYISEDDMVEYDDDCYIPF